MFRRLFGYTKEEQLLYLQPRVFITAPVIILGFLALAFKGDRGTGSAVIAIAAYVWAWTFLKNWFGITTIGAVFSENFVIGILLFMLYLVVGYLAGLIIFVLGLFRYIQLKFFIK